MAYPYPDDLFKVWGNIVKLIANMEISADPDNPTYFDSLDVEAKLYHARHQLQIIEKQFSRAMGIFDSPKAI